LVEEDSETLLRWRNDPVTRRNSINTAEISPEEHARWFRETLSSIPQRAAIADIGGVAVGVVRFGWNDEHDGCDLSFTVAPEHRGKGCGFAIVEHAMRGLRNVRVTAEVKMDNRPSRCIFDKLGFQIIDSQGELLLYAKDF